MKSFLFVFFALATSAFAQLRGPAPQILVPAAGSVVGSNGTFFHSDIAIYNFRNQAQSIMLQWLPRGSSGASVAPMQITLSPLSGVISEDFVASILHQQGLGAMIVTAVTDAGQSDPNGRLVVTSRIWTPQPGSTGTVSQSFPTIATAEINTSAPAILGQRVSDEFRTNVGIVNLTQTDQTFDVLQNSDDPTFAPVAQTVTVHGLSMEQVSLLNTRSAALQVRVTPHAAISPQAWVTYGSSVDNVTGDSWSSLGMTVLP